MAADSRKAAADGDAFHEMSMCALLLLANIPLIVPSSGELRFNSTREGRVLGLFSLPSSGAENYQTGCGDASEICRPFQFLQ